MSAKQAALAFALLWVPAVIGAASWSVFYTTYQFLFWWSGSDTFAGIVISLTVSIGGGLLFGFGVTGAFEFIPKQFRAVWRRLA